MSNQLLIHFQTHYSENEAGSELCCNAVPALLFDEIKKANGVLSATEGLRQMDINPCENKYRVCVITMSPKMH